MYILNKVVWYLANPMTVLLAVAALGAVLLAGRGVGRRLGAVLLAVALIGLWFASTVTCVCLLGLPLERRYLSSQRIESLPKADAIVVLGGGVGKCDFLRFPDMYDGADRVWHAARLWKADKAPVVIVSGTNELNATIPLLLDLGVRRDSIVVDNESRNTYENSRFTERIVRSSGVSDPTVLLVTSAWHMNRAVGNFSRTSVRVVPAACDFTAFGAYYGDKRWCDWFMPSADSLARTGFLCKEWLGRLARK